MKISAIVFFAALITGLLSLALAAVVQVMLPQVELDITQGSLLLNALRSALTEEGSRFIVLALLFVIMPPFKNHESDESVNAAAGMIAGLAFAAVETASLAAANPLAGPVRLISAVFLHAACGIRGALAASTVIAQKLSCISSLVLAIALHTVYNFMTPQGGILSILAILLAVSSFSSGLRYMNGQKNSGASGR
jgi:RsiW-degrading membrane proteinase PrsW (M82 family)